MRKQKYDLIYFSDFHIKTPIVYTHDVLIDASISKEFPKDWEKFRKKHKDTLSKTRKRSLVKFMDRIKKEGSDAFTRKLVSIEYIDKDFGYGVFAKKKIGPYQPLTHYAGLLTLDEDLCSKNDSAFTFTDFSKYAIDGKKMGSWARFMNHADDDDPNKNMIPWELYLKEGPRIVFTTGNKGLKKGEQLLYSYGDSYWE